MSKFFTYNNRLEIQKQLKDAASLKSIAKVLDKNSTTVSREIKKYSSEAATGYPGFPFNECKNRFDCRKKKICISKCTHTSATYCKLCSQCNHNCEDFIREICTARFRPPYVCNGCDTIGKCSMMKTLYEAEHAHIRAKNTISSSQNGLCVSEEEITRLNGIISPLVQNGQSIHQIYINHEDELMCSEKTIYNYIDACLLDIRNIDLPRNEVS